MSRTRPGPLQLRIMKILWQAERASAREITDALNADPNEKPVAHSTVQTLLRQLEEKGSIAHSVDNRTFVFFPLVEEDGVTKSATRDLIERVYGGSTSGLISYLLKEEKIPRRELQELRKLIDEQESTPRRKRK